LGFPFETEAISNDCNGRCAGHHSVVQVFSSRRKRSSLSLSGHRLFQSA
jgi:hypothetical protein